MNKTTAILLAAGKSERLGKMIPKPFLQLGGKAVYRYSLDIFLAHPQIDAIILVVPWHLLADEQNKIKKESFTKPIKIIAGGETRFESIHNALKEIDNKVKNVFIHDTARPFISKKLIDNCIAHITKYLAVTCAIQSSDTLVNAAVNSSPDSYPDRTKVLRIQTPQVFDADILKKAYALALKENKTNFTDDSSMIHHFKLTPVFLIPGCANNFKITYPNDLPYAEIMLKKNKLIDN